MDAQEQLDYFSFAQQGYGYNDVNTGNAFPLDTNDNSSSMLVSPLNDTVFLQSQFDYNGFGNGGLATSNDFDLSATESILQNKYNLSLSHSNSLDSGISMASNAYAGTNGAMDIIPDTPSDGQQRRSSEDCQAMSPSQSRRKVQNRAAQRAFRERKERHVQELEAKLATLTTRTSSLQTDNGRLKLLLQRTKMENEILRATRSTPFTGSVPAVVDAVLPAGEAEGEDLDDEELPSSIQSPILGNRQPVVSPSRHLDASATWDLLQQHPLFLKGAIDLGDVCDRLKKLAKCEGSSGPVFDEREVRRVIEEVARAPSDELI